MEPFGLFQILQNLLTQPSSTPSETPPAPERNEPPANPPPTKEELPSKNAAAAFLEAHEKRAQKTRKK